MIINHSAIEEAFLTESVRTIGSQGRIRLQYRPEKAVVLSEERRFFGEHFTKYETPEGEDAVMCLIDGEVVGCRSVHHVEYSDSWFLDLCAVSPKHCRNGIARIMNEAAFEVIKCLTSQRVVGVSFNSDTPNDYRNSLRELAKKAGFELDRFELCKKDF